MPVGEDTEVNACVGADAVWQHLHVATFRVKPFSKIFGARRAPTFRGKWHCLRVQCGRKHRIRLCDTEDFAHTAWGEQQRWVEQNVSAEQLRAGCKVVLETEQGVSDK